METVNTSQQPARDDHLWLGRIARKLRRDEQGAVLLLTAIMVFVLAIFGVLAMDTSRAIYNRVIAQNAVDAAADSAALWQARGCNLLQLLNNLHYDVDMALYIGETVAFVSCGVAAVCMVLQAVPIVGAAAAAARNIACFPCAAAPYIDKAQEIFVSILMPIQKAIAEVTPFLAFANANSAAHGSGADELIDTVLSYAKSFLNKLGGGLDVPALGQIADAIPGGLGISIPLYAAPLDPRALSLGVEEKQAGEWDVPWSFAKAEAMIGVALGYAGCPDRFPSAEKSANLKEWGWQDKYYYGNPGFMTWIAGRKGQDELIGLGKLRWLNGGKGQDDVPVNYTGDVTASGGGLQIPAFVAIASSQVEGTPVVAHGDVDANGKIIKVWFPGDNPKAGDSFWIYH